MKALPTSPLWRVSFALTALIVVLLIIGEFVLGFDWFATFVLLLSVIALLGVWQGSGAGKGFLTLLLVFEIVFLVPAIVGAFGLGALSGQGFTASMRLLLVLIVALVFTAIPLGTYTTYLNKMGRVKDNKPPSQISQG